MTFKNIQWLVTYLGLAAIELTLLYKLILGQATVNSSELMMAICIIGILFILLPGVDSLRTLSLGKEGFKVELEALQELTAKNERAVTELIILSMSDCAYVNLVKLADGAFGEFKKPHDEGLETELYHLSNLGYIEKIEGKTNSIRDIPESGEQLSDYIYITEKGKAYLALRKKFNKDNDLALLKKFKSVTS